MKIAKLLAICGCFFVLAGPSSTVHAYSAWARCSVTRIVGTAHGFATRQEALSYAISDCAYRGGIPECCRNGAYHLYSAYTRCPITEAEGTAHGFFTRQEALSHAIRECVGNGGIPACCRNGVYITTE